MVLLFHMKQILILVRTVFVELIYLTGDLKLSYQFVRLLLKVKICSACKCNYLQT